MREKKRTKVVTKIYCELIECQLNNILFALLNNEE